MKMIRERRERVFRLCFVLFRFTGTWWSYSHWVLGKRLGKGAVACCGAWARVRVPTSFLCLAGWLALCDGGSWLRYSPEASFRFIFQCVGSRSSIMGGQCAGELAGGWGYLLGPSSCRCRWVSLPLFAGLRSPLASHLRCPSWWPATIGTGPVVLDFIMPAFAFTGVCLLGCFGQCLGELAGVRLLTRALPCSRRDGWVTPFQHSLTWVT